MGYAIARIGKLKTTKEMSDSFNHNMRIFNVINADPLRRADNETLVDELNGRSYEEACEDEVRRLRMEGFINRGIRKDAVRGFEVMLTFSQEDLGKFDIEEWKKKNLEWLDATFNPPDHKVRRIDPITGEEKVETVNNVKSVIVHNDEQVPHIHAFIVPISPDGKLNAHYYTGQRAKLLEIQNSYGAQMKEFGLSRGERFSVATPEQRSKYYNKLIEAVDAELPAVEPGETAEHYRARANEVYQTASVHHRNEIVKKDQEIVRELSGYQEVKRRTRSLAREMGEEELTPEVIQAIHETVREQKRFKKAVQSHPDSNMANDAELHYNELIEWQKNREREEKRRERKEKDRSKKR